LIGRNALRDIRHEASAMRYADAVSMVMRTLAYGALPMRKGVHGHFNLSMPALTSFAA
jgi:hypothetical protein